MADRIATERSKSKTFRLKSEVLNILSQEAKERNISLNEVVNQLVLNDLKARRGLRGLKPILVPALTLQQFLENLPDERIIKIGERVANDVLIKRIPFEISGRMTTEAVLQVMKTYHEVIETSQEGKRVLILAHYAGQKYSLFVGTRYKTLFAAAGTKVSFSVNNEATVFVFE